MENNEILEDIQDSMNAAKLKGLSLGTLSDGYHTYNALYGHRVNLFMALGKAYSSSLSKTVWISRNLSDGTPVEAGWFIMGIGTKPGKQITYHLPGINWDACAKFAEVKRQAPEYDGHTSADVLTRLLEL
jgi:hypothetical protein